MKRFAICALGVMVLAGIASAQDATVWLEWKNPDVGEPEQKCIGLSETAVVQIWIEVTPSSSQSIFKTIDTILASDNVGVEPWPHYDVIAFNDFGPWGTFERKDPRGFFSNPPDPNMPLNLNYQFIGDDTTGPPPGGLAAGMYLLDEIVIRGTSMTQEAPCPPCDTANADRIMFAAGTQAPGGFTYYLGWGTYDASIAMLTGSNTKAGIWPLHLAVIPEPASLSLLALGGLAVIRRRR